jgi:hypothetical protein
MRRIVSCAYGDASSFFLSLHSSRGQSQRLATDSRAELRKQQVAYHIPHPHFIAPLLHANADERSKCCPPEPARPAKLGTLARQLLSCAQRPLLNVPRTCIRTPQQITSTTHALAGDGGMTPCPRPSPAGRERPFAASQPQCHTLRRRTMPYSVAKSSPRVAALDPLQEGSKLILAAPVPYPQLQRSDQGPLPRRLPCP